MSYGNDKVKVILRSDGQWVEGDDGWDYIRTDETFQRGVKLPSNITYQHLVDYVVQNVKSILQLVN